MAPRAFVLLSFGDQIYLLLVSNRLPLSPWKNRQNHIIISVGSKQTLYVTLFAQRGWYFCISMKVAILVLTVHISF